MEGQGWLMGCEQNGFLKKELPTQILCLVKNNFPKQKEREAFPAEGRLRGLSPPHRCRRVTIKNYLDRKEINEGVVAYQDGKTHTKQTHEQTRCTFHSLDFWIMLIWLSTTVEKINIVWYIFKLYRGNIWVIYLVNEEHKGTEEEVKQ